MPSVCCAEGGAEQAVGQEGPRGAGGPPRGQLASSGLRKSSLGLHLN